MKKVLAILISGLFLVLALRGVDWTAFSGAFAAAEYWYLVPAVAATMLGHLSRAHRWGMLLKPVKKIKMRSLWSATAIGFMANNLLPARLGELIRALVVARAESISGSAAFATIIYERILDVFVVVLLLGFGLVYLSEVGSLPLDPSTLIVANVVAFGIFLLLVKYREKLGAFVKVTTRRLRESVQERVWSVVSEFLEGLAVATHLRAIPSITVASVSVWGFAVLSVYCCASAQRLELSLADSAFLLVVISLGAMIPSAPAYLGTIQYACIFGLGLYGIEKSEALAFSAVYHAVTFFPITLAGLYSASRAGLKLSKLSDEAEVAGAGR